MQVIVGSGPVGTSIARLLAEGGERVRMISRSGSGPEHPRIERVAADATDRRRLTELAAGAETVYNCANPKYTEWEQRWFPMNDAMIAAAKATGAVYAITGNLYDYGPQPGGHMREDTPPAAVGRKGSPRPRPKWACARRPRTPSASPPAPCETGQSSRPTPARRGSPAAPNWPTAVTPPK
jgi:nucleoside-diphosphate-sugar epimerase